MLKLQPIPGRGGGGTWVHFAGYVPLASLLIHRTIKYLVKSNDWGERYNSVVFFFYLGRNCDQKD